jgi:Icc-related predicted phosphoesterase
MKIFATSDIHGNRVIIEKLHIIAEQVDLILICGDIGGKDTRFNTLQQFSAKQKEDEAFLTGVLKNLPIPSRFILGNDDWFDIEVANDNYLSKRERIGTADLIPFEFVSITPFNTNREVNDNKLNYELHKICVDENSIIVAHTPPHGAGDILYDGSRCGSKSVRAWILEKQPPIWLCGHIHENNSVNMIGRTHVFNCACWYTNNTLKGWIIDTASPEKYEEISI